MKLFTNFLKILGVGIICSFVPFLWMGMLLGAPAYILAAVGITLLFRKELS
jgi:hypothetical protein